MRTYTSTPATTERCDHAEGPSWDARTGRLIWVDQYAGLVHVADYHPGTATLDTKRTYNLGHAVGAVVPMREPRGWMVASAQGFAHLAQDGTLTLHDQPAPPNVRMNDGKCDDAGRFWAGTMGWDKAEGAGSLYRLDPDGTVTVALTGVTISNGPAFPAGGDTMYFTDTPLGRVDRFRLRADGSASDRVPAITVDGGAPDGMCVDDDGCLWVAVWGAGVVRRHAPDGQLLATVHVDAPQVSSCCLGGPDGRTLLITTSQEGMGAQDRAAHPQSGRLFCVDVETPGPPAAAFGTP